MLRAVMQESLLVDDEAEELCGHGVDHHVAPLGRGEPVRLDASREVDHVPIDRGHSSLNTAFNIHPIFPPGSHFLTLQMPHRCLLSPRRNGANGGLLIILGKRERVNSWSVER